MSMRENRALEVLNQALTQPETERAAFLDRACIGDPTLREDVERLLAIEVETAALVGRFVPFEQAQPGQFIGGYRVLGPLGEGGMGLVYKVQDAEGRTYALKTPKVLRIDRAENPRFEQEADVARNWDHPGICATVDAGNDGGLPFIVMEFVPGEPITGYCEGRDLSTVYRLFREVCEAVGYAHQRLVVHRDLKPSNILVHESETGPRVKLLDFGIAKVLNREETALTSTASRPMTRQYAAPEQVLGEDILIATDVYALGVVLYELLSGELPYVLEGLTQGEAEQLICEFEPPRPSKVVHDRERARALTGDLDAIVLHALEKEPARRYQSVQALLEDLDRHFRGEPVLVRPDTLRYRAAKLVQRHGRRIAAGAVASVFLLLVGAIYSYQVGQARDLALREALAAEAYASFLEDIFDSASPNEAQGDTLTAFDLLDQGVRKASSLPAPLQSRVLETLGRTYVQLGAYPRADSLLVLALFLKESDNETPELSVATSQASLAALRYYQGRYHESDSLFYGSLTIARQHGAEGKVFVADAYNGLAASALDRGRYPSADSLLDLAITARLQANDTAVELTEADAQDLLTMYTNRASVLSGQGNFKDAHSVYGEAIQEAASFFGVGSIQVANILRERASLLIRQALYDEAVADARGALTIYLETLGTDHINTAYTEHNLAVALVQQGSLDEALSLFEKSLETKERLLGSTHVFTLQSYAGISDVYRLSGEFNLAIEQLTRLIALTRASLGPEHPDLASYLNKVGRLHVQTNRFEAAIPFYTEALEIRRSIFPAGHPQIGSSLNGLGNTLIGAGRPEEAEVLLRDVEAVYASAFGERHPRLAEARRRLGIALFDQEKWDEAEVTLRQSYEAFRNAGDSLKVEAVADVLIQLYHRTGRPDEASRLASVPLEV